MEITEVRIKLTSGKNEKLRAFCSITIDNDFVIRDLKVIEGAKGAFVAMPSRKLMARCPFCGGKNHYRAPYCNECGARLSPEKLSLDGRRKLHADVAHPINSGCRESIQQHVLAHYEEEKEKSKDPDYRPVDLDDYDDDFFEDDADVVAEAEDSPCRGEGSAASASRENRERESDLEPALEESEWEEEAVAESETEPAFGVAQPAPGEATGDRRTPSGVVSGGGGSSGPTRGPSFQRGGDRDRGGRPGRPRARSGRRRRGREPRREGGRLGERDRPRDSAAGGRPTTGGDGDRSRLAVDFEDLGPRASRSRRPDSARRDSAPPRSASPAPGEARHRDDRHSASPAPREARHRDDRHRYRDERRGEEARGEPRFRERGPDRASDAAASTDRGRLPGGRIPDRRLAEELDVEPEDNFGAGLFS